MGTDSQLEVWEVERQWLRDYREDTPAMAQNIAEDVIDDLAREIDDATEDGFVWDIGDGIQTSWLLGMSLKFEEAMGERVLSRLQNRAERLHQLLGDAVPKFDDGTAALDNLRKSLHLIERMQPHLKRMMARAEPGLLRLIARAVNDDLDDMDAQWQADGKRLRETFQEERQSLCDEVAKAAEEMIQRLRFAYQCQMKV